MKYFSVTHYYYDVRAYENDKILPNKECVFPNHFEYNFRFWHKKKCINYSTYFNFFLDST